MKGRFKAATGRVIYVPATSIFQGQVPKTRTTVRENVPSIMHKRKRAYAIFSQCAYAGVLHVLHTCIQQPKGMCTQRLFRITLRLTATRLRFEEPLGGITN